MQSEDFVISALRKLAEQDRGREAPEEVEARVIQAFRRRRLRKNLSGLALASLAAAAGITVFFAMPREHSKPVAPVSVIAEAAQPAATAKTIAPQKRPRPRIRRQPREIVTQFFPLLDAAPPFERGELLRVTVPASTMRKVGLPVNEERLADPIYADVLVGQEGLARAIRFVRYE